MELLAAMECVGARIEKLDGYWIAHKECDCHPFDWIRGIYEKRNELGKDGKGYPLKIALAALYGKFSQHVGLAPYFDEVIAGAVTATTRAAALRAIGRNPGAVFMLATDAVFSTCPLDLDIGEGLGQWRIKKLPDLFVVRSGFYWTSGEKRLMRHRGAPLSLAEEHADEFEAAWDTWYELPQVAGVGAFMEPRLPWLRLDIETLIGLRFAHAAGKPEIAGRWQRLPREMGFGWSSKRATGRYDLLDGHAVLYPKEGGHSHEWISQKYTPRSLDEDIDKFDLLEGECVEFTSLRPEGT